MPYNSAMTIVGLISDTHGRLHEQAYAALADCDFIIHAGDIGNPSVLRELQTIAPVSAVLGNNDYNEYGKNVSRYARPIVDGVRFLVAHFPHDVRISAFGNRALSLGDPLPDICIHGHTHLPRLDFGKEARPASYIINPGSASYPRGGFPRSIGKITIINSIVHSIVIEGLDGETIMSIGLEN